MAKSRAQIQADYRKRHGSNNEEGRINAVVPVTVVTQLEELATRNGIRKKAMLQRLIEEEFKNPRRADLLESSKDTALRLLDTCRGDYKKARELLLAETREKHPWFNSHSKDEESRTVREEYGRVRNQLNYMERQSKRKPVEDAH